jgi:transposase-like protein
MSKRSIYSEEEKYNILMLHEEGFMSFREIKSMYNTNHETMRKWRYKYETYGIDGLKESRTWKRYSKDLKEQAVKAYLSGENSLEETVRKYEISDTHVLRNWIVKYNSHSELQGIKDRRNPSMTKGRPTSWKERIEITQYCIANNKSYLKAAELYGVSYNQVYQWVKKWESDGEDALRDGRGRNKSQEELTSEEKIKLELKKIEAENERLRAENAFLKKLEELERRRS